MILFLLVTVQFLIHLVVAQCPDKDHIPGLQNYLWKIESPVQNVESYFFGIFHSSHELIWPYLHDGVKNVFNNTDVLVTELTHFLGRDDYPKFMKKCPKRGKNKKALDEILPFKIYSSLEGAMGYTRPDKYDEGDWEDLWQEAELHNIILALNNAKFKSMPLKDYEKFKSTAIENFLIKETQKRNKKAISIEPYEIFCGYKADYTIEELISELENLYTIYNQILSYIQREGSTRFFDVVLNETANEHKNYQDKIENYLCGTWVTPFEMLKEMDDEEKKNMKGNIKSSNYNIYTRNSVWVPRIEQLFKEHPDKKFFFALGINHFLSPGGLLDIFQKKNGYKISSISFAKKDEL